MAKYAVNYSGLRLKPSYDSLVQTIANQPMIIYPNRMASIVRDSPYMTALQDLNNAEMADEDEKRKEEEVKKTAVRQAAAQSGGTASMMEASAQRRFGVEPFPMCSPDSPQPSEFQTPKRHQELSQREAFAVFTQSADEKKRKTAANSRRRFRTSKRSGIDW